MSRWARGPASTDFTKQPVSSPRTSSSPFECLDHLDRELGRLEVAEDDDVDEISPL